MSTQTATPRLMRLHKQINSIDMELQKDGDFIPTDIDVIGFRFQRDEPILLFRQAGETLALRDEATMDERGNAVPGFLDVYGDAVAAAHYGPSRMYHLGVGLYELFATEVEKLDGTPAAVELLVEDVKQALRRLTGVTG